MAGKITSVNGSSKPPVDLKPSSGKTSFFSGQRISAIAKRSLSPFCQLQFRQLSTTSLFFNSRHLTQQIESLEMTNPEKLSFYYQALAGCKRDPAAFVKIFSSMRILIENMKEKKESDSQQKAIDFSTLTLRTYLPSLSSYEEIALFCPPDHILTMVWESVRLAADGKLEEALEKNFLCWNTWIEVNFIVPQNHTISRTGLNNLLVELRLLIPPLNSLRYALREEENNKLKIFISRTIALVQLTLKEYDFALSYLREEDSSSPYPFLCHLLNFNCPLPSEIKNKLENFKIFKDPSLSCLIGLLLYIRGIAKLDELLPLSIHYLQSSLTIKSVQKTSSCLSYILMCQYSLDAFFGFHGTRKLMESLKEGSSDLMTSVFVLKKGIKDDILETLSTVQKLRCHSYDDPWFLLNIGVILNSLGLKFLSPALIDIAYEYLGWAATLVQKNATIRFLFGSLVFKTYRKNEQYEKAVKVLQSSHFFLRDQTKIHTFTLANEAKCHFKLKRIQDGIDCLRTLSEIKESVLFLEIEDIEFFIRVLRELGEKKLKEHYEYAYLSLTKKDESDFTHSEENDSLSSED